MSLAFCLPKQKGPPSTHVQHIGREERERERASEREREKERERERERGGEREGEREEKRRERCVHQPQIHSITSVFLTNESSSHM